MTKTLYLLYDGDSYEIELDPIRLVVLAIWRYAGNKARIPEVCQFANLDEELQQQIDHKMIQLYGEPHNGELGI